MADDRSIRRSRADDMLEDWKMVARTASRPADAPHPRVSRSALPAGMLAVAALALVAIVVLSSRGGRSGPESSLPAFGASQSIQATATPTTTPLETAAPTPAGPTAAPTAPPSTPSSSAGPSSSPTTGPTSAPSAAAPGGTPTPADATAARNEIDGYTAALVRRDYPAAWAMLAPQSQAGWGSEAGFAAERGQYFQSAGSRYTVVVWPTDVAPITSWLSAANRAQIDLHHAVLVEVDYAALAGNNAGYEVFIVNRTAGGLEIFSVR